MATKGHLAILAEGIPAWNSWRTNNPDVIPDLSDTELFIDNIFLPEGAQKGPNLSGADLSKTRLEDSLGRCQLTQANLSGANLESCEFLNCDFSGANLASARIGYALVANCRLPNTDLTGAVCGSFQKCDFTQANFSAAKIENFYDCEMAKANFNGAALKKCLFWNCNLREADFTMADLTWAKFGKCILDRAKFGPLFLTDATFSSSSLKDTDFGSAGLILTTFASCDISEAKLDNVRHIGPSAIGIDVLYQSKGLIPEKFLRGCGVPETLIRFIPSLIGAERGIEFYSCFISYSSNDEDFAKRLCGRMRDSNLRVWFAPEDMKSGRELNEQIESAIGVYDKLLVVLSEASLQSNWVISEIRKARKYQRRTGKRKLFPVRLVDFRTLREWECFDADTGQDLAVELRKYFIPDFSDWKDHDSFEKAFDHLLRSLKAEEETPPA